jgi:U3 small nucleolar ribonucleoprotein protein IMP4
MDMLITTSRKPSQRTRTFCRGLERVIKARCINRGKMSIREVFLNAKEMKFDRVVVISERDGNPSGLDIYLEDELIISIKITVDLSAPIGMMKKDQTVLRCDLEDFKNLAVSLFAVPMENPQAKTEDNLIWIKGAQKQYQGIIEFYNSKGLLNGPRIFLHHWNHLSDEKDGKKE